MPNLHIRSRYCRKCQLQLSTTDQILQHIEKWHKAEFEKALEKVFSK